MFFLNNMQRYFPSRLYFCRYFRDYFDYQSISIIVKGKKDFESVNAFITLIN